MRECLLEREERFYADCTRNHSNYLSLFRLYFINIRTFLSIFLEQIKYENIISIKIKPHICNFNNKRMDSTYLIVNFLLMCNLLIATTNAMFIQPTFDRTNENVTVIIGNSAVLPCFISNLGDHKVNIFLFLNF